MPARTHDLLADIESVWNAHRFNRYIHPIFGMRHDLCNRIATAAVNKVSGAKGFGHLQPAIVQVHHDDLGGGIELCRQQCAHPHRACTHNRNRITGFDRAVEHTDLVTGGQDITEHYQRLFIRAFGDRVETVVSMRNADILGLSAINQVAQNPAAILAVGIHLLLAVFTLAAGGNA